MRVMLIQAEPPDDIQDFNFPMGYAALDAVLTQAGHEVEILSTVAYHLLEKDIADRTRRFKPQLVGIGGMWPYLPRVEMLVGLVRQTCPEAKVVLGGWMVTYLPELVLRKAKPDFCVAGEGETALLKLANALDGKTDYSGIPGLVFRDGGQVINNGMGQLYPLDEMPMPNWEKFPMEYYLRVGWYFKSFCTGYDRVMGWATSRGCPGKCNFCTPGTSLRYKKMDLLMAELHEIEDRFHPTFMYWMDNLTMASIGYGKKFAQRLIDEKFKWRYFMTGRVDRVDRELLQMLKESGCACILYGLESANNELLKFMGKNTTVEQFVEAVRMTKEAGIAVNISGMFGQPGETLQDFYNTLKVIMTSTDRKTPFSNNQGFYPLTTFPGSPIYDWAREHGYFKDDDDFYDKFFRDRWINYTDYPHEVVPQALRVANMMNTWNYHHHQALNLEDSLLYTQSMRAAKVSAHGLAYRLKERLDAMPKLKTKIKGMIERRPLLKRMACRALGRNPGTGLQAAAADSPTEPAASGLLDIADQAGPVIDPSWPAEKQLDVFIDLVIKRYFRVAGETDVVLSEQAGTLAAVAKGFYDAHDYERAIEYYKLVVERNPDDSDAWCSLGWAYQNLGLSAEAEPAFRRVLEISGPDHRALRGLGWARYKNGKYESATESFNLAFESIPEDKKDWIQEICRGRGWCLFHLGRYREAIPDFERAIENTDSDRADLLADLRNGLKLATEKANDG